MKTDRSETSRPPEDDQESSLKKEDSQMVAFQEPLLTTKEAAAILGVSERHLQYEVARGRISVVRLSRNVRFNRKDLRSYIERHTVAAKETVI
jgi:excisionase family DNA binding protein